MIDVNDWEGVIKKDSVNIRLKLPIGAAFITIVEDVPGKICRVFFQIGKAGSEMNAQCAALAELISVMFREGKTVNEVISHLQGHAGDRVAYLKGGFQARSGPEALALALTMYRNSVPQTNLDDGRRPARIATKLK